jgi:hypothetical protein
MLPEIPFRIAGDGPLFRELSARLPGNVTCWDGSTGRCFPISRQGRFVVVPAMARAFGMVAIEAMSHGLPVVAAAREALRNRRRRENGASFRSRKPWRPGSRHQKDFGKTGIVRTHGKNSAEKAP